MADRSTGAVAPRRRPLGRRRRRLYWTLAVLVLASLAAGAVGYRVWRASRPATYRTGEAHAEITSRLDLGIPEQAPEPRFVDVTAAAGLGEFRAFAGERTSQLPEDMGSGAAWGDFDADGDDDLFLVSQGGPLGANPADRERSRLYENLGDGTFREVTGFPETRILGMGAAWGDHDGDGRLDLVVTGFDTILLFRNDEDGFRRVDSFPSPDGFWAGASWSDFDLDGDLDLYVCGYVRYDADQDAPRRTTQQYGRAVPYTLNPASFRPERNLLFRNEGAGKFREVAEELGVSNPEGRSLGALWWDLDDDGRPDLYVANDISDNALYLNREDGFQDVSHPAWVADYRGAMGLAAGDWNRDGDDDLFVTHWVAQENALYDSLLADLAANPQATQRGLRFMDVADQRGLGQIALQRVGWGAEVADLDADGWLDLVVANGSTFETDGTPKRLRPEPSFLFWNNRGESFHDLAPLAPTLSTPRVSRGLALSDYDGDADLDVLFVDRDGGVRLLRNDMPQGNSIRLRVERPRGPVEGTRIVARVGDTVLRRVVAGVSYLSQSTRTVHLGLGEAAGVDALEIRWPGGAAPETHRDLAAGTLWVVTEGNAAPRAVERKGLPAGSRAATAGPGSERKGSPAPHSASGSARESERERLVAFWNAQRAGMNAMKVDDDCAAAIPSFRRALELNPTHGDALYYLGNCLAETGDVEGALDQLARLMESDRLSHRAHKSWGTLRAEYARSEQDLAAANAALERALEINPEETGVMLVLGQIALVEDQRETARQRLEWVVRSNPQSGEAFWVLAYLAWSAGDAAHARELLAASRGTRKEDWKPEGTAAEGEVRRKMHVEWTPLHDVFQAWDGAAEPDAAFAPLERRLREYRQRVR